MIGRAKDQAAADEAADGLIRLISPPITGHVQHWREPLHISRHHNHPPTRHIETPGGQQDKYPSE